MKKKLFLLCMALLLGSGGAQAQQGLQWNSNIRSIVFQTGEMIINYFDGTQSTHPLADVRSLIFTGGETSAANPAERDNFKVLVTGGELRVESTEPVKTLTVFDLHGRMLYQANAERLNIAALASGVYLLRIETAAAVSVQRFIKH